MSRVSTYAAKLGIVEIEQIRDRLQSHSVRMKKSELTLKQVSAVPCPTCGVAIGLPCVLHSSGKRLGPHVDRKLVAIEAFEVKSIYSGQQYYFLQVRPSKMTTFSQGSGFWL
jgi:hypothetical protein